jgi:hypothetical protein
VTSQNSKKKIKKSKKQIRILSGGQTGVDRAALDFALKNKLICGGWCPKGRIAEDGKIPDQYPLTEAAVSSYSWRTELNVRDSDATLVIYSGALGNGTELTIKKTQSQGKPLMLIDLDNNNELVAENFISWINANKVETLNIAGPRESTNQGIYLKTIKLLEKIIVLK